MSKSCDITVILDSTNLDSADRCFFPDSVITGHVLVEVHHPKKYADMTISHLCYTHGKGTEERKQVDIMTVNLGELAVGSYELPFEFVTAKAPFTYHGEVVNLEWCIEAKIDQRLLVFYQDNADFILMPSHSPKYRIAGIETTCFKAFENLNSIKPKSVMSIIVTSIFVIAISGLFDMGVFGVNSLYGLFGSKLDSSSQSMFTGLFTLPLLAWFVYFLPKNIVDSRHDKKMKQVELITDTLPIKNQSHLPLHIAIRPKVQLKITKIVARFVIAEYAHDINRSSNAMYHSFLDMAEADISPNKLASADLIYKSDVINLEIPNEWSNIFSWQHNQVLPEIHFDIHTDNHVYEYKTPIKLEKLISS